MTEHPYKKRRALEDAYLASVSTGTSSSGGNRSSVSSLKTLLYHQQQELESLQADLDHERSLRLLESKKTEQTVSRLERKVALAVEEAEEHKELLELQKQESDRIIQQLKQSRTQALQHARELQMELEHRGSSDRGGDDDDDSRDDNESWKRKYHRLEQQVKVQTQNEEHLKGQVQRLRSDFQALQKERAIAASAAAAPTQLGLEEPAPMAIQKELNTVRLQLADTERANRQMQRKYDELNEKYHLAIRNEEKSLLQSKRVQQLQSQVDQFRQAYEQIVADLEPWKLFQQTLQKLLQKRKMIAAKEDESKSTNTDSSSLTPPPDTTLIVQALENLEQQAKELRTEKDKYQSECQGLNSQLEGVKNQCTKLKTEKLEWVSEKRELQTNLETAERKVQTAEHEVTLYQRESASLRSLLQTFESASKSAASSANEKVLQVNLNTTKQKLQQIQTEKANLETQLETLKTDKLKLENELDRVKDKFGKLRDALMEEKNQRAIADQRANDAEALAGKGSFNPTMTNVFHFQETPLIQALKEEIQVLKRQVEHFSKQMQGSVAATAADGTRVGKSGNTSNISMTNPDKLNQRLKENFKEQIALFREGVYLMTGYKIDMLAGTERPTFRIRSMYAEQEDDHLLLQWPKGENVTSLDILNTPLAKILSTTSSYQYLSKYHSLPAFLAGVQLNLFEQQTHIAVGFS